MPIDVDRRRTNSESPVRLLVVDDDRLLLESLSVSFARAPGIEMVAAVWSGSHALETLARERVDVALVDIEMPGMDGVETTRRVVTRHPEVTVVMYTNFEHEGSLNRAIDAGAKGFLTKDVSFDELADGVCRAHRGSPVLSDRPVEILLDFFGRHPGKEDLDFRQKLELLPEYLLDVLDDLILGLRNREIARRQRLAESSVRTYVSQLLQRTGCTNRSQLAARATRAGYQGRRYQGAGFFERC